VGGIFVVLHPHAVHLFLYLVRSLPNFEVIALASFLDGAGDNPLSFHVTGVCSGVRRVAAVSSQEPSNEVVVEGSGRVEWSGLDVRVFTKLEQVVVGSPPPAFEVGTEDLEDVPNFVVQCSQPLSNE